MGMDQPPSQPPSGGAKPPDWGEMGGKLKAAQGPNKMILIAGVLFFVDSFLPWLGVKASVGGVTVFSINIKGWSSGFLAVVAILLALAATVLAALEVVGMSQSMNLPMGPLMFGLTGGAFVFALLRWITEISLAKYGLYIAIVLGAVMAYGGWQKYQAAQGAS
jgi:hypothetical protein